MKMLFCKDIKLGAEYLDDLDSGRLQKWQYARSQAVSDLIDLALREHVAYVALFGNCFGRERVPENTVDEFFKAVSSEKSVEVLLFAYRPEYDRLRYRNDIPEQLHVISIDDMDMFVDDNVAVRITNKKIELQLGDADSIGIIKDADRKYYLQDPISNTLKELLSFEPVGFEDDAANRFGYSIIEWKDNAILNYKEVEDQQYRYVSVDVKILPEDDHKAIVKRVTKAVSNLDHKTFARISIHGRLAFGTVVGCDEIREQLQNKLFSVEVFDNSVMDIAASDFENDISLKSEFVRLALADDTLSETERTRLIRCGWNVLNGKGVSVE